MQSYLISSLRSRSARSSRLSRSPARGGGGGSASSSSMSLGPAAGTPARSTPTTEHEQSTDQCVTQKNLCKACQIDQGTFLQNRQHVVGQQFPIAGSKLA